MKYMIYFNLSSLWCCAPVDPTVDFRHSHIEASDGLLWTDVFIQVDRTTIWDSDYLKTTKSGETISPDTEQYKITKDQGNTSGVAKIFLPREPGNYDIFYIREENYHARILGKYIIKLSPILISSFQELKVERVHYPPYLQALLKRQGMLFTVQETSSPGRSESIKSSVNHSQLVIDEYPFEIIPKSNMYNKVNPL
ncbi:unnamed protein product [Blepharisma stoltei]|uniref:Uncharacterized protein n=1 Tax=Blepharisma stoltei TaxID=1481888 RepID=A0AAU9JQU1_9CILI|nr:unnamed protein product [Blepharisma stoltei]